MTFFKEERCSTAGQAAGNSCEGFGHLRHFLQRWENLCREQSLIFLEESQTQLNLEYWTVHLRVEMDKFCKSCCTCKEQMGASTIFYLEWRSYLKIAPFRTSQT